MSSINGQNNYQCCQLSSFIENLVDVDVALLDIEVIRMIRRKISWDHSTPTVQTPKISSNFNFLWSSTYLHFLKSCHQESRHSLYVVRSTVEIPGSDSSGANITGASLMVDREALRSPAPDEKIWPDINKRVSSHLSVSKTLSYCDYRESTSTRHCIGGWTWDHTDLRTINW